MLRRKLKRGGNTELEEVRAQRKKSAVVPRDEDNDESDQALEKLVFGGQDSILKELEAKEVDLDGNKYQQVRTVQ